MFYFSGAGQDIFCGMQTPPFQADSVIYSCQADGEVMPRLKAGHDNEAEVLQKSAPPAGGARR